MSVPRIAFDQCPVCNSDTIVRSVHPTRRWVIECTRGHEFLCDALPEFGGGDPANVVSLRDGSPSPLPGPAATPTKEDN